ncbi:MAG TPA: RES family NAD+ phosphorylase [Vicinamibacterales bacterium]|nr:RES family NAD+ phosphorylase [Vicinamibacterales bacterium]
MILHRCFAWNVHARPAETDGPLWFPRIYQGEGRHDNPDLYGCLYAAERAVSSVVEQLARFRGQPMSRSLLVRRGLPLAVAALELPDDLPIVDLDDPKTLGRERLRPSVVATRARAVTQPQARRIFERHAAAAGLRWWSTLESSWINVTVFDRAAPHLRVADIRVLNLDDALVAEASHLLGLEPTR